MLMRHFDREALRQRFQAAEPFPYMMIDDLLDPTFAHEVAAAYPSFESATEQGHAFKSVNERLKVQITDAKRFPEPIARLNAALASPEFLTDLSYITGIPNLLADSKLVGGGIHMTGPGGRLDVHVDFNYIESRNLHRRLNLLLYLNPVWEEQWGGHIQIWDKDVKQCYAAFAPVFNRCVVFATSDISFHGVTPVTNAAQFPRRSFATYYYTREAPPHWKGNAHSTIFKARPEERMRWYVLMPAEIVQRRLAGGLTRLKQRVKQLVGSQH